MLAVAGQMLLPLFNASVARAAPAGERVAVCTSLGIAWISLGEAAPGDDGSAPDEGDALGHLHCPFCAGGAPVPSGDHGGLSFRAPAQGPVPVRVGRPSSATSAEGLPPPPRAPPIPT